MSVSSEKRKYILKLSVVAVLVVAAVACASVILWGYVKPDEDFYIIFNQYPDIAPETVEFSSDMELPKTAVIDGYAFDGWYYEHDGKRGRFDPKSFDPKELGYSVREENFLNVYGKWSYKEQ